MMVPMVSSRKISVKRVNLENNNLNEVECPETIVRKDEEPMDLDLVVMILLVPSLPAYQFKFIAWLLYCSFTSILDYCTINVMFSNPCGIISSREFATSFFFMVAAVGWTNMSSTSLMIETSA